jgi:hypothetical protein
MIPSFSLDLLFLRAVFWNILSYKTWLCVDKIIGWSNGCAVVGLLTMGFGVNLFTVICLSSLYTFSRWTMVAHHTCHGGYEKIHPNKERWSRYEKIQPNKERWSRFKFGLSTLWRRFNDWFDWSDDARSMECRAQQPPSLQLERDYRP